MSKMAAIIPDVRLLSLKTFVETASLTDRAASVMSCGKVAAAAAFSTVCVWRQRPNYALYDLHSAALPDFVLISFATIWTPRFAES